MAFDKSNYNPIGAGFSDDPSFRAAYNSSSDSLATILASGYFATIADVLSPGDLLLVVASDDTQIIIVTAVSPVTTALFTGITRYAEVTISTAQVLAIRATPITLVAAPGAGRILTLKAALLILDYNSIAYTESADNMAIKYTNGSGAAVSQAIEMTGFIDQTADMVTNAQPKIDTIVTAAASANQALVLHNTGDGEYAAGNSPIRVKVSYQIHYTGL